MATIDLSCTSARSSVFKNNSGFRITYTATNGTLTITEIAARRTDGFRSFNANQKAITVSIGGVSKSVSLSHYIDFGTNWVTWGAADTSWTGLTGTDISITATMPTSDPAYSGAVFNGNAAMSWSTYTVSYNANGGSGAPSAQTKTYDTALTLTSTKPTRTGYSFKGWATSASGAVVYASGAKYTNNAAVTLYAVWAANTYTVSYNANGGTGAPANQTKTYGKTLTLSSAEPTRENYNFLGWGTSASATTVTYTAGAHYTTNANITLYAVWELAYIKPRISGLMYSRCNAAGEVADGGTNALISFSWESDRQISAITIEWKIASAADYAPEDKATVEAAGTYGAVNTIIGAGTINSDKTYTLCITVTDSSGSSYKIASLPGSVQHIDFLAPETEEGKGGAAIGKPAELQNVFDVGYQTKFTGGLLNIVAEKVSDLNDLNTPNTYVSINKGTESYANAPTGLTGTFTVEVMSAGAEGQLLQRLTSCSKTDPNVYTRLYYQGTWGEWIRQFEVALYNNTSGSTGVITLSESVENFEYIEIFYTDNNNKVGGSMKVYSPQGKTLSISVIEAGSGATTYFRRTTYTVSGTTITPDTESAGYVRINTATPAHTTGSNYIKICRVVGFERGFM